MPSGFRHGRGKRPGIETAETWMGSRAPILGRPARGLGGRELSCRSADPSGYQRPRKERESDARRSRLAIQVIREGVRLPKPRARLGRSCWRPTPTPCPIIVVTRAVAPSMTRTEDRLGRRRSPSPPHPATSPRRPPATSLPPPSPPDTPPGTPRTPSRRPPPSPRAATPSAPVSRPRRPGVG